MNKDKYICEKLGLCWHEKERIEVLIAGTPFGETKCTCGKTVCHKINPDFTSEAGRIGLLKLIMEHPKYSLKDYVSIRHMINDEGLFRDGIYRLLKDDPYKQYILIMGG